MNAQAVLEAGKHRGKIGTQCLDVEGEKPRVLRTSFGNKFFFSGDVLSVKHRTQLALHFEHHVMFL